MWIDQPDKPGYWIFIGKRTSRSKQLIVEVAAPVLVAEKRGFPELIVFYTGQGLEYGVSQHTGKWRSLQEILNDNVLG